MMETHDNDERLREVSRVEVSTRPGEFRVAKERVGREPEGIDALWPAIRHRTPDFENYASFIETVVCKPKDEHVKPDTSSEGDGDCESRMGKVRKRSRRLRTHVGSVDAYQLLKTATEAYLLSKCGVLIDRIDEETEAEESQRFGWTVDSDLLKEKLTGYLGNNRLPYLDQVVENLHLEVDGRDASVLCEVVAGTRVSCPCLIELIWSYWHEEGMLVQTMNALSTRFQNKHAPVLRDPLATLAIDPLRPLSNLLWGFIQDETNRLSVARRAYEYDHEYGLKLVGKAIPEIRSVDSRSNFIQAFHNLLITAAVFYAEDANTDVIADGFPLLNALKEVHMLLAEGAHNQFGDLPWTARVEMMMMQWILQRPEMREFLGARAMLPYPEPWMPQVDAMKKLQGWSETSIIHYVTLAQYGEQILLSIRYADWLKRIENDAIVWARYWRPEIRGYMHSFRTVTGTDLNAVAKHGISARLKATTSSVRSKAVTKQTDVSMGSNGV